MRKWAMAAVLFGAMLATADAQTEEQRTALNQIADATSVEQRCPSLVLNGNVVGLIALAFNLRGDNLDRFAPIVSARLAKNHRIVEAMDADAVCLKGRQLFGPDGTNVPNLLVEN